MAELPRDRGQALAAIFGPYLRQVSAPPTPAPPTYQPPPQRLGTSEATASLSPSADPMAERQLMQDLALNLMLGGGSRPAGMTQSTYAGETTNDLATLAQLFARYGTDLRGALRGTP